MSATIRPVTPPARSQKNSKVEFIDLHPPRADFRAEVLQGLARSPKSIPPKFFYDENGSRLFEEITRLPEYYPTRTEIEILEDASREIAGHFGDDAALIEFGSGSSRKVRILLEEEDTAAVYMPIDISGDFLLASAEELAEAYPRTQIIAVCADYTQMPELPDTGTSGRKIVFFPGSTIGNLEPDDARQFLRSTRLLLEPGDAMVVGVDQIKDERVLNAAYNDARGVTAEFNLNLLARINRELGGNFDLEKFEHHAFFNAQESRIEMHLVSRADQDVVISGQSFRFSNGESIHTENSYKYGSGRFRELAEEAGYTVKRRWTDDENWFAVHWLEVTG